VHNIYTHFQKRGHDVSKCQRLYPTSRSKHTRKEDKKTREIGTKVSIIDVLQDDSHVDFNVQSKESPLVWIGNKLFEFLFN